MKQLTLTELAGYMKGRVVQGDDSLVFDDAVIDSREAKAGAVFFPLIGEFQNGHKYIVGGRRTSPCPRPGRSGG